MNIRSDLGGYPCNGNAALAVGESGLLVLEGGLSRRPEPARREPRPRGLSARQTGAALLAAALVVAALCLASALSDGVRASAAAQALASSPRETVVVRSGDTLWGIAEGHADGLGVRDVVEWISRENGLDGSALVPGQRLVVPAPVG